MHDLDHYQKIWTSPEAERLILLCKSDPQLNIQPQDRTLITKVPAYQTISSSVTREAFLKGRVLARDAMKQTHGNEFMFMDRAKHSRAPAWPTGTQGCISHTHGFTAVLVTTIQDRFFGIDVENNLKPEAYVALRDRILRSQPKWGDVTPMGILEAFTIYESIYKASHQAGLPEPTPKDLSVKLVHDSAATRIFHINYLELCQVQAVVLHGPHSALCIAEMTLSPCNFYTDFLR